MSTVNSKFDAKLVLNEIIGEELAESVKFYKTKENNVFVKFKANEDEVDSGKLEKFKKWLKIWGNNDSKFNKDYERLMTTIDFDKSIKVVEVFKRVGCYNNNIYIDLCNDARKVVKIGDNLEGQAWTIINEAEITDPILFQRTQGMQELSEPKRGDKNLKELLSSLINVNDTDLNLIMCWLLIALNPDMTCPMLFLNAGKGQGKSTTTKFIKSIIDPDTDGALSPFDNSKDFNVIAASRYVLPLDNMGKISEKFSNQLCRAVTGSGISNRKLFTDYEYIDKNMKSHIIINGIDCIPARSALRDRCYFISMQKLDAENRKSDSELKQYFKNMQAEILGALLTVLHGGLVSNYKPKFDFDIRMLDAAIFACKCINADKDNILQISEDDFKYALSLMKADTEEIEIQEDDLTEVLYEMALKKYEEERESNSEINEITLWDGTTKELLRKIQEFTCDTLGKAKVKKLPDNPRKLGKKIGAKSQFRPILEQMGLSFEPHRKGGTGDEGWIITFCPKRREIKSEPKNDVKADFREDNGDLQKLNDVKVINSLQENSQPEISADEKKTSLIVNSPNAEEFNEKQVKFLTLDHKDLLPTSIPCVYGISPNNSEPLPELKNLSPQEMAQAVMSNYFIVPQVRINTIIWKNWDLFSMRRYIWTVVRSRPDCVKIFVPDGRCYLCRPNEKEGNMYIAELLSKWGKEVHLFTGSLRDALNKCEDHIDDSTDPRLTNLFENLIQNRPAVPVCIDNYRSLLNQMGISTDYINETNEITRKMPVKKIKNDYTLALLDQLTKDAEPNSETAMFELEIIKRKDLYYSENIDLLSEKDVDIVYKSTFNVNKPGRKKNQQKDKSNKDFNLETFIL